MPAERYRARAIMGQKDKTQLVLARKIGEGIVVFIGDQKVEITLAHIATNSAALIIETAEENLVLRKELLPES